MADTEELQIKQANGDVIALAGLRVTSTAELLEVFQAHLGLHPGEKISKLSFDTQSGEWTIEYRPLQEGI